MVSEVSAEGEDEEGKIAYVEVLLLFEVNAIPWFDVQKAGEDASLLEEVTLRYCSCIDVKKLGSN
jgi:hypothetical protein